MTLKDIAELAFWVIILVVPLTLVAIDEQHKSRIREIETRRRERNL